MLLLRLPINMNSIRLGSSHHEAHWCHLRVLLAVHSGGGLTVGLSKATTIDMATVIFGFKMGIILPILGLRSRRFLQLMGRHALLLIPVVGKDCSSNVHTPGIVDTFVLSNVGGSTTRCGNIHHRRRYYR